MKKMDDEDLQKWFDDNKVTKKANNELISDDAKAYQFLFDVLDTEPTESLPYNFSANVTRKVQAEAKRTNELRYYIWALVVFVVVAAVLSGISIFIKPGGKLEYLSALSQYKWPIVLVVFCFLTIQYFDQVLIKVKMFRNGSKM
jgi:hypothetical protein